MKIRVVVHQAEEGGYWAEVPAIPGCATQGESLEELLANLREAMEGCLSANPEWTDSDFERAVTFSGLAGPVRRALRLRGPQKAPTKELISIRLSRDVVQYLRKSGRGWQARVDAHLRSWVAQQQPRSKRDKRPA